MVDRLPNRALLAAAVLLTALEPVFAEPKPAGGDFLVNSITELSQFQPAVAVSLDGSFVAVWTDQSHDGSGNGVYMRRFDADGTPRGDDRRVNTTVFGSQEEADVAIHPDGSFLVVWESWDIKNDRDIFGQRFDANGDPRGGELQVNVETAGIQRAAAVAPAADGGFVVVWETDQYGPQPTLPDVRARRFDSEGQPLTGDLAVNVFTDSHQREPDVATDAAGNFVVVWESAVQPAAASTVVARRFDPGGQPLSGEIFVNAEFPAARPAPDVAVHPDGRFAIVWSDLMGPYLRYYTADGTPTTGEVLLPELPAQNALRVVLDHGGQALVASATWIDGPDRTVILQHFDVQGNQIGIVQHMNTDMLGINIVPRLAIGAQGHIVAVWEERSGRDGWFEGVFGRRYVLSIFADGFESGDLSSW